MRVNLFNKLFLLTILSLSGFNITASPATPAEAYYELYTIKASKSVQILQDLIPCVEALRMQNDEQGLAQLLDPQNDYPLLTFFALAQWEKIWPEESDRRAFVKAINWLSQKNIFWRNSKCRSDEAFMGIFTNVHNILLDKQGTDIDRIVDGYFDDLARVQPAVHRWSMEIVEPPPKRSFFDENTNIFERNHVTKEAKYFRDDVAQSNFPTLFSNLSQQQQVSYIIDLLSSIYSTEADAKEREFIYERFEGFWSALFNALENGFYSEYQLGNLSYFLSGLLRLLGDKQTFESSSKKSEINILKFLEQLEKFLARPEIKSQKDEVDIILTSSIWLKLLKYLNSREEVEALRAKIDEAHAAGDDNSVYLATLNTIIKSIYFSDSTRPWNFSLVPPLTKAQKIIHRFGHQLNSNSNDKVEIFYNNDSFLENQNENTENAVKGLPLNVNGNVTGYNIFFPEHLDENTGLVIMVYGGGGKGYSPKWGSNRLVRELHRNNMVVAALNLLDLLLLKNTHQRGMSMELHMLIHEAMQNFIDIVCDNPLSLLPAEQMNSAWAERLARLSAMRKILYGASFGGGVVARHLQMYGGSKINGAFSFNGALSIPCRYADHLLAANYMDKLKAPLTIWHYLDDNRVSPNGGIKLFLDLTDEQREFVSLRLEPRGNPLMFGFGLEDLTLKGHGPSREQEVFEKQIQAIINLVRGERKESSAHMADFYGEYFDPKSNFKTYLKIFKSKKFEDKVGVSWQYFQNTSAISAKEIFFAIESLRDGKHDFTCLGEVEKNVWRTVKELFFLERDEMKNYYQIKHSVLSVLLPFAAKKLKIDLRNPGPVREHAVTQILNNQVFNTLSDNQWTNLYGSTDAQNETWQKFVIELRRFIMAAKKAGIFLDVEEWLQALDNKTTELNSEIQPAI